MNILDLPIELLRPIIKNVLRCYDCGHLKHHNKWTNPDVVSLARVNTVFETEVFLLLEEHRFLVAQDSLPSTAFTTHPEAATFISQYVSIRPYADQVSWKYHYPALVNAIVDAILNLKPPTDPIDNLRTRYIATLCRQGCPDYYNEASYYWRNWSVPVTPFKDHLLVAAIYLNEVSTLGERWYLDYGLSETRSMCWGTPLRVAMHVNDLPLVRTLLHHGAPFSHTGWLNDLVAAPNAPSLLRIFITEGKLHHAASQNDICDFAAALLRAVALDKEDVTVILLDTQRDSFAHPRLNYYLRAPFLAACKKGFTTAVQRFIRAGGYIDAERGEWKGGDLRTIISATCDAGQDGVLRLLLDETASLKGAVSPSEFVLPCAKAGRMRALG